VWFFPPCCPVQVLSCALCLHHVFLSEQIKLMMMMMIYTEQPISTPRIRPCSRPFGDKVLITLYYVTIFAGLMNLTWYTCKGS